MSGTCDRRTTIVAHPLPAWEDGAKDGQGVLHCALRSALRSILQTSALGAGKSGAIARAVNENRHLAGLPLCPTDA